MNEFGKTMIAKGFPKVLVEGAFEFSNEALGEGFKSLIGEDLEDWKLMQKAMMAAYLRGARHMADILGWSNEKEADSESWGDDSFLR